MLRIDNLVVEFKQRGWRAPPLRAVDGVSLTVGERETLGLVGESGSGKSTIGRALLGLVQPTSGSIEFNGANVTSVPAERREAVASALQVVFQDPFSSLDPSQTVGATLREPMQVQLGLRPEESQRRAADGLRRVGITRDALGRYPRAFSGGQRQRIAVARALSLEPSLVVCDEVISALDLITQAQVVNLLDELQDTLGLSYLFITHNLAVVRHVAQRIVVLYAGRLMEEGPATEVCAEPQHPYTRALLAAALVPNPEEQRRMRQLRAAMTSVSSVAADLPPKDGCPFAPRCPHAVRVCWEKRPVESPVSNRRVACHLFDPGSGHPQDAAALDAPPVSAS